jgi:predicted permease
MRKIWAGLFKRSRFESDLACELQFHMEARAADLERSGHSAAEARRLARIELGAIEHYKEECRQARGLRWFDELKGDLSYALRGLRRNPVFAAVAILTLSLGIGANATIFALVNSVMFKTLPVEKPEQLQAIYWMLPEGRPEFASNASGASTRDGALRVADMFAYPSFVRLREQLSRGIDLFAFSERDRVTVEINGQAQLAHAVGTSWNYFRGLGISAYAGRTFQPDDEDPAALTPVAVLSHQFWMHSFGGDRSILGKSLNVADGRFIVVGVLPPGFHGLNPGESIDVLLPLPAWDRLYRQNSLNDSQRWWVKMMARVEPSYPVASFQSEMETRLVAMLRAEKVSHAWDVPGIRLVNAARGLHWLRKQFERPLRLLMLVAMLILLMAAVNVGGLLLARSEARVAETGTRLSLGASRLRIARQHFTESILLASLGLFGGLLLASLLSGTLPTLLAQRGEAPVIDITPDPRFLVVAVAMTLTVAALFGLFPAWKSSRLELTAALKRSHGARTGRLPLGRALVGVQVGLSLVLLICAAMFLRTVSNLRGLKIGFAPEHLLVFNADPTLAGYRDGRLISYFDRALEKLSSTPEISSVSVSRHGLLTGGATSGDIFVRDDTGRTFRLAAYFHNVTPGYFETIGIPLLAGRDMGRSDRRRPAQVALVNQKLARMLRSDGGSPVGQRLFQSENGEQPIDIIGVVGDAKYEGLRDDAPATIYRNFYDRPQRQGTFTVKTSGDPRSVAASVRRVMAEVDPRVPIYDLRTEEEQISIAMERERILAALLTGFGSLALVLAAVGIYGVLSYSVTRRTSEIGVRLALGAVPANLRSMIFRESLMPVAIGLLLGLLAASWFAGLIKTLVFGIEGLDLWSVTVAIAVLGVGASLAAFVPAHRASRVDPMTALRYE